MFVRIILVNSKYKVQHDSQSSTHLRYHGEEMAMLQVTRERFIYISVFSLVIIGIQPFARIQAFRMSLKRETPATNDTCCPKKMTKKEVEVIEISVNYLINRLRIKIVSEILYFIMYHFTYSLRERDST